MEGYCPWTLYTPSLMNLVSFALLIISLSITICQKIIWFHHLQTNGANTLIHLFAHLIATRFCCKPCCKCNGLLCWFHPSIDHSLHMKCFIIQYLLSKNYILLIWCNLIKSLLQRVFPGRGCSFLFSKCSCASHIMSHNLIIVYRVWNC